MTTKCRGCNRTIDFIMTEVGKKMPIDLKKITIVTLDGKVVSGFTSHFATCPKSYEFKTKKKEK